MNTNPAAAFLATVAARAALGRRWRAGARYREGFCICHGEPQTRSSFRDDVSWAEFRTSSLCQSEQDVAYAADEDEEAL